MIPRRIDCRVREYWKCDCKNEFIMADGVVLRKERIVAVDLRDIENYQLKVLMQNPDETINVTGFAGVEMVWHLKPGAIEGKRLNWVKGAWIVHNLIGHPLMQILAFFGYYDKAMWIHDATVPKPIERK